MQFSSILTIDDVANYIKLRNFVSLQGALVHQNQI